ncbi:serine/threonine protein kinase [Streptomyces sp. CC77]|nr:serine/threonine protein kinase [Streptomyces sp. CC77]
MPGAGGGARAAGALQPLLPADPSSLAGYRLLGRLGAGGMGVVYLGRTASGELAAVKVTHAERADQADFRARFRREVEAARRVTSPWAVPVTGADPDAPEPWMATAFVPGPSLGEAVHAHGPLPERSVRVLGGAVARALAAVHEAGLVHRDVKPGNVLLAVDGPRLIDFGIARVAGETGLTSADVVVGTPGFLAPEQAAARAADIGPASDVFSLGCLLAFAATGRPPFGTGTADALLYRTVHDDPDVDGVPEPLLPLVRRCLAKDPAERPTAEDVADRLTADAEAEPPDWLPAPVVRTIAERSARMLALPDIDPTEPGAPPEGRRAPGRRRFLLSAGGAVLAAGAAVGARALYDRGGDAGGAKTGAGARERRWVIGVHADLTGPAGAIGRAQEQGARLAVELFNARPPSGGSARKRPFTLTLKVSDDRGDPSRALAAARALTTDPDVLAVLGPTSDTTGEAAMPAYDEARMPVATVSAGLNLLAAGDLRTLVRAIPSHPKAGNWIGFHVLHQGSTRPGIVHDRTDDVYGWQYMGGVDWAVRYEGASTPYHRVVPAGTTDYRTVIRDMLDHGIDAYVHCGVTETAVRAALALHEAGFTGPRATGQRVFDEQRFLREAGAAAEGWAIGAPAADPAALPSAAAFRTAHARRFGAAPAPYAGEAFDVVNLMIDVLVEAAAGGSRPGRAQTARALLAAEHRGAMGAYSFDASTREVNGIGTYMYVVEDGRTRYVGAAPLGPPGKKGS